MARLFNGTSQSIECAAPVTGVPLTLAAWVNFSATSGGVPVGLSHFGGSSRFQIGLNIASGTMYAGALCANSAGTFSQPQAILASATTGVWYHVAAVFTSNTSRVAYINGVASSVDTTLIAPTGIDRLNISGRYNVTLGGIFSGAIAEVSVWNAALSAQDIRELALAYSPARIAARSRVYLNRLIRESQDLQRGAGLTDIGGATPFATHPRIIG